MLNPDYVEESGAITPANTDTKDNTEGNIELADTDDVGDGEDLDGITGMNLESRNDLVYLIKNGVVEYSDNQERFERIIKNKSCLIPHLYALHLTMIIDEKNGLIILENLDKEKDEDKLYLLKTRVLTLFNSLLLVQLRKYYMDRIKVGEQLVVIDLETLENLMAPFLPISNRNSLERRDLRKNVEDFLKQFKFVKAIKNSEDRYEISSLICHFATAEKIRYFNDYVAKLSEKQGIDTTSDSDKEEYEQADLF